MHLHPAIARLRYDPSPQFRAQAALEAVIDAWRAGVRAILDDLRLYGEGAGLSSCRALGNALAESDRARALVDSLFVPIGQALARHPLGHVPLRHQVAPGLLVLQLATSGRAALTLVSYEAHATNGAPAVAQTVCFSAGERHECCLAGSAELRLFELADEIAPGRAHIRCETRRVRAGDVLYFDGAHQTKIVDRPRRRFVILRLSRSDPAPSPSREFRIADGELIHQASGDPADSRDELAMAVLGAMGRADAAPVMAALAEQSASDHLRWQALRQALALDTATGFASLSRIARTPDDHLASPANALRDALINEYPQLAQWSAPCPVC